ncbi:hypothetical protein SDC9_97603 [bioreactor metagenome]|uniref:Uncharacterized protein n=1 Tax=bioreactor metagenome TaxID=1076179 RepID=A0A645ACV9_9ZZZZ
MVHRADHVVKVHATVEKSPGHITHQRTQKVANVHGVRQRPAVARGPGDVHEILVAAEAERTQLKRAVAQIVAGCRLGCCGCGHDGVP